jgi:hypothetical protein
VRGRGTAGGGSGCHCDAEGAEGEAVKAPGKYDLAVALIYEAWAASADSNLSPDAPQADRIAWSLRWLEATIAGANFGNWGLMNAVDDAGHEQPDKEEFDGRFDHFFRPLLEERAKKGRR